MPYALAAVAGLALWVAFPPIGWGWTAVVGMVLLQVAALRARSGKAALGVGAVFTVAWVAPFLSWLASVELEAWIGIVVVHLPVFAGYAWVVWMVRDWPITARYLGLAGGWVFTFLVLRWLPVFSFEWLDPGYTVAGWEAARNAAALWGATGWGVLLALAASGLSIGLLDRRRSLAIGGLAVLAVGFIAGVVVDERPVGGTLAVTVVQGHPECPTFPCSTTREEITDLHLRMTEALEPGPGMVVWGESSTGFTTDPGQNAAVAEAIARETNRLGAHLLLGSDRPAGSVNFVNANLLFDPEGRIVGEYRKQHPVPFGEYLPARELLGDIYPFTRQPRDMIPGDGPVLFDLDGVTMGTVISFEGAFGRYAREHAALGAQFLVVNTNEGSYEDDAAADQLIGMTSMRAAELGLDVVHVAVSGKSTFITDGGVPGEETASFVPATLEGTITLRGQPPTPYARWGDWLVTVALLVSGVVVVRQSVVWAASEEREPLET